MDNAVTLVQAYLRLNGYFTVTEFPIVEAIKHGGHRTATDIDVLAFRFPSAGRLITQKGKGAQKDRLIGRIDSALGLLDDGADMIIGEVKEGRAQINHSARDPAVLRAALTRFGCCHGDGDGVDALVESLIRKGQGTTEDGHRVRIVAFGSVLPETDPGYHTISLGQVIAYAKAYLNDHWEVFRVAELKDPALGFLATMIKSEAESTVAS